MWLLRSGKNSEQKVSCQRGPNNPQTREIQPRDDDGRSARPHLCFHLSLRDSSANLNCDQTYVFPSSAVLRARPNLVLQVERCESACWGKFIALQFGGPMFPTVSSRYSCSLSAATATYASPKCFPSTYSGCWRLRAGGFEIPQLFITLAKRRTVDFASMQIPTQSLGCARRVRRIRPDLLPGEHSTGKRATDELLVRTPH